MDVRGEFPVEIKVRPALELIVREEIAEDIEHFGEDG